MRFPVSLPDVPASGSIEVAFSPDEGSEHLVVKVIDKTSEEEELQKNADSVAILDVSPGLPHPWNGDET